MNLYVCNLAPETTREDLQREFSSHGEVRSVTLLTEQMRHRHRVGPSRGMGFVAMPNEVEARVALAALHHREIHGRAMTVEVARPSPPGRHRR